MHFIFHRLLFAPHLRVHNNDYKKTRPKHLFRLAGNMKDDGILTINKRWIDFFSPVVNIVLIVICKHSISLLLCYFLLSLIRIKSVIKNMIQRTDITSFERAAFALRSHPAIFEILWSFLLPQQITLWIPQGNLHACMVKTSGITALGIVLLIQERDHCLRQGFQRSTWLWLLQSRKNKCWQRHKHLVNWQTQ